MAEETLGAGAERIHEWLAESSLAFAAASEFPFGPSPLALPDFTFDEDPPTPPSSSDNDDDGHPALRSHPLEPLLTDRFRANTSPEHVPSPKMSDKWAPEQPFLYNGRLLLVCFPGLMLVLSLGGDLLITVVTIGSMLVHLLHSSGEPRKAFITYICTFMCSQIIVVYSAFPLLWHTILNLFLIGMLNSFTVLTGAWGLLFFSYFRVGEAELTKIIETSLFSFYPGVNVILLTWIIAAALSPIIAPYALLSIGFMILQLFMTPAQSSFWKVKGKDGEVCNVLDSNQIGAMALAYTVLPPGVYMYLTFIHGHQSVISVSFMVEFIFLGSLSSFLATLMNLREFLEVAGMDYMYLVRARWALGITALVLLNGVLHKYGFSISLLPWLALGLALHTGYGFITSHRKYRAWSLVAALLLIGLYGLMFTRLPWRLQMYLEASHLHINYLLLLMFLNTLLCVVCIYIAAHGPRESLGFTVVLQSLVFVACEKFLWYDGLYSNSLLLISTVFAVYALLRLQHAHKYSWTSSWLSVALHLTKVSTCLRAILPGPPADNPLSHIVYEESTTFILALVFLKGFLFENQSVSFNRWLIYMAAAVTSLVPSMSALLSNILFITIGRTPIFSDLTALGLLMTACLSIKLSLQGSKQSAWLGVGHVGPTAIVTAVVLFFLKPEAAPTWEDINKWVLIATLVSAFLMAPIISKTKSSLLLCLTGCAVGLPVGASCTFWLFPGDTEAIVYILYGVIVASLSCKAVLLWRNLKGMEKKLYVLTGCSMMCSVVLLYQDSLSGMDDSDLPPGLLATTASSIITAFLFKVHSLQEKPLDLTSPNKERSWLALVGNVSCVTGFLLTCLQSKAEPWEIWYVIACSLLLLLQRDSVLFRSLGGHNNSAPMLIIITLILLFSSTANNALFADNVSIVRKLAATVELVLLCATLPLYFVFITTLWSNKFYISDRLVVFITPLNVFFLIFGSSYQVWALATYALGVGYWLMTYRLPLQRDYI